MRHCVALIGYASIWWGGSSIVANAYPMIVEVPEESERVSLAVFASFISIYIFRLTRS